MLTKAQQWQIALSTIESLYEGELEYPLKQCVYVMFGLLVFNPKKPLGEDVKKLIVATFNIIYVNQTAF